MEPASVQDSCVLKTDSRYFTTGSRLAEFTVPNHLCIIISGVLGKICRFPCSLSDPLKSASLGVEIKTMHEFLQSSEASKSKGKHLV